MLRSMLLAFLILPLVFGATVISPSPAPLTPPSSPQNIVIGLSVYATPNNGTNCWLSPSGDFAFGFHPFGNDIGIWLDRSSAKTLVWTGKVSDFHASSMQLNSDGMFVLRRSGVIPRPLFNEIIQPVSYATMNDNGNFVIYNTRSEIIWQSFDHPTDTLVSGQTMGLDKGLVSTNSNYFLDFDDINGDGYLVIGERFWDTCRRDRWGTRYYKRGKPVTLNLDSAGRLYLVNKHGLVTKNITHITQGEWHVGNHTIYRATLGSDGYLRVFGETVGGEITEVWRSTYSKYWEWFRSGFILGASMALFTFFCIFVGLCCHPVPRLTLERRHAIIYSLVGVSFAILAFACQFFMRRYPKYV